MPAANLRPPNGPMVGGDGVPVLVWLAFFQAHVDRLEVIGAYAEWLDNRIKRLEALAGLPPITAPPAP